MCASNYPLWTNLKLEDRCSFFPVMAPAGICGSGANRGISVSHLISVVMWVNDGWIEAPFACEHLPRDSVSFKLCNLPVILDLKVEYVSHGIINRFIAFEITAFWPLPGKWRVMLCVKMRIESGKGKRGNLLLTDSCGGETSSLLV